MDYTDLKAQTVLFSHRSDLDLNMDTFAALAEALINKDLRTSEMEKRLPITVTDTYFDLPSDYMELRALHLEIKGARDPLQQMTPQVLDRTYSRATGSPRAYAIHGGQIEFRPGISITDPFTGELKYYARVLPVVANSTNAVLTQYPLIYLSAMLVQVYLYTQDDPEMQKWASVFDSQVTMANKSAQGGRYILPSVQVA